MRDIDTKISTNRQPEHFTIHYEEMRVGFCFGSGNSPGSKRIFSLPIKAYGTYPGSATISVAEDDIKALCLNENHSLADFEAIRRGIKGFLRDHQTYVVNDIEYRVRREDILCEFVNRVIRGERVAKVEDKTSEAA